MASKSPGRPKARPDTQTFIVRLPLPESEQLRTMAAEEQRTITAVMLRLLRQGLAQERDQAPTPAR